MALPKNAEQLAERLWELLEPINELENKLDAISRGEAEKLDRRDTKNDPQWLWNQLHVLGEPTAEDITRIIHSFPSLRESDGSDPFESKRFLAWLASNVSRERSPMSYYAGWFFASLHCPSPDMVPFDGKFRFYGELPLHRAFAAWDDEHRRAYAEYMMQPRYLDGVVGDYYANCEPSTEPYKDR